jgi:hypothetical protein
MAEFLKARQEMMAKMDIGQKDMGEEMKTGQVIVKAMVSTILQVLV